ncbi:MAG: DUF89 family protein [Armatimonadetes bacterium]|nr:DUF89 family protein [Armatimonadota bacterium]
MKARVACLACLLRQALNTARECTDDPHVQKEIMDETMRRYLAISDPLALTPGELSQNAFEAAREVTGIYDPYLGAKRSANEAALALYPALRARLEQSDDPLLDALLLATAGNIIDLGIAQEYDMMEDIVRQVERGFDREELAPFRKSLSRARSILYLADNAGEIVFDRILIEELGPKRVTLMVKSGPIVNDALMADAVQTGLADLVRVVETGSNYFGFPWGEVSEEARDELRQADLVISKGHANFETVSELGSECDDKVWYLLKVKCPDVAEAVGGKLMDVVLLSHRTVRELAQTEAMDFANESGEGE